MDVIDEIVSNIKKEFQEDDDINQFISYLQTYYNNIHKRKQTEKAYYDVVESFFEENIIYYNKTTKSYFKYSDYNYEDKTEDNITYEILNYINDRDEGKSLSLSLKNKIQSSIIRKIKSEYNIFNNIPESETIQVVTDTLCLAVFNNKYISRFFLVYLGCIILKLHDHNSCIIYTSSDLKTFLQEISNNISSSFGTFNLTGTIKLRLAKNHTEQQYKYLLPCKHINYSRLSTYNNNFYTNMICVAVNYANRYGSIDNYIGELKSMQSDIYSELCYLNINSNEIILTNFISNCLIEDESQQINEQEIIFLWKEYQQSIGIFINIYSSQQELLQNLYGLLNKQPDKGVICGYYNLNMPIINMFKTFWNDNFFYDENEYYFEISEIIKLFAKYRRSDNSSPSNKKFTKSKLTENLIILIINTYYDNYKVVNGKYIHNIRCNLWDKHIDIDEYIETNNINVSTSISKTSSIILYGEYNMEMTKRKKMSASKKYFDTYIEQLYLETNGENIPRSPSGFKCISPEPQHC